MFLYMSTAAINLVMFYIQDIGPQAIEKREEMLYTKARACWTKLPNMVVLGAGGVKRLPIFSFIVRLVKVVFVQLYEMWGE